MVKHEAKPSTKKALYFFSISAPFVYNDIQTISHSYSVKVFQFKFSRKLFTPLIYLKQLWFLITNIYSSNVLVCFFGGYQSILPSLFGKIFRRPCLIVVGGTDCVSFPSINYGNFNKFFLGKVTCLSYRLAAFILPVHKSLVLNNYTYQDADFDKQGFMNFCKGLKTPWEVVSFGFDPDKWVTSTQKIPNSFITVASWLENPYRAALKGVDLILEAAKKFPDAHFTIIGFPKDHKLPGNPTNITTHAFVSNEELKDIYNKHEFYIQVSMSEGFPNAICEAMTCGCIPIGSNVGGLPDIIGDSGYILYKRDVEEFKELLKKAISSDKKILSEKARQRILINYPKDLREKQLLSLLSKLSK
jgi:glycosyltransferase involved in cell wall biosynthesis